MTWCKTWRPAQDRGDGVQSEGGPRLKGRPVTCSARALGADAAAMCRSGTGKLAADGAGSKARPSEPHQVQWPWLEVSCASPCAGLDAALNARPLLLSMLQTPPSLPLRMSIDSAAAGAASADRTARKLSQTARRKASGRK